MTRTELSEILERYRKWLAGEGGVQRADLSGAVLCGADLSDTVLRGADLSDADLGGAVLCGADLRSANLRGADLSGVDLRGADLRGAELYNCCLPLWCGGLRITLDRRQMAQLIFHFCSMVCGDPEVIELQKSLYAFANEFAESRFDLKNRKFPEA